MLTMPRKSRLRLPPIDLGQETMGQRLTRLRKERGYTQVELAQKVGIIQAIISDYERDQLRMHAEMVARFALALDVSADILLGLEAPSKSAKKRSAAVGGSTLSLKIVRRLQRIENLPEQQQKKMLQSIDMLLGGVTSNQAS